MCQNDLNLLIEFIIFLRIELTGVFFFLHDAELLAIVL